MCGPMESGIRRREGAIVSGTNGSGVRRRLRVALIVGGLGKGGAEKQLVYMARALLQSGVDVRVYCLTKGEFYEAALQDLGIAPRWIGRFPAPPLRVLSLVAALRDFRPHIVQSTHFFTNIYAAAAGRAYRAVSIGGIRSDAQYEMEINKFFGPMLLRGTSALLANSNAAKLNAPAGGVRPEAVTVIPNVIDLSAFDGQAAAALPPGYVLHEPAAMVVCNLRPKKRVERFLRALALARREVPGLTGVVVGEGPMKEFLHAEAGSLGLLGGGVQFLGRRDDVPALLRNADIFVMPSEHEGFPNVILEAMSASLPVVTTPAGDAGLVVVDGVTGYVVGLDDVEHMAERLVSLGRSEVERARFGREGRRRVEELYSYDTLGERLLAAYMGIAVELGNNRLRDILSSYSNSRSRGDA